MSTSIRRIGPYELLEPLGRGGMGTVHRAVHQGSGRTVALKTVHVPREGLLRGLRREIHALARLEHPGIVRVLDEGVHEGSPWYAMELLEGATLRAWSQRADSTADTGSSGWWTQSLEPSSERRAASSERQPEQRPGTEAQDPRSRLAARSSQLSEILTVTRSLCSPLAYLHGEGIVHRDLKPENVLLRNFEFSVSNSELERHSAQRAEIQNSRFKIQNSPWPALVDFGLATQFAGSIGREALDFDSGLGGTVAYMAPEQVRGQMLDARADLYALGCVLYELLAGRPPFVGQTPWQVLDQHLEAEPRPPSEVSDWLGRCPEAAQVDAVVLRLLAKEPRERFGHALDVAAALGRLGAGVIADPAEPRPRAYLYRPGFAGRAEPMSRLDAALARLQRGVGGAVLVGGESGVGKTRLLMELGREAAGRKVLVLAGECFPGAAGPVGARLASPSVEAEQASTEPADAASEGSGSKARLESARAPRGRSDRSPRQRTQAGGSGPLEALRKPLQRLADRCRERGAEETDRLLGRRGKVLAVYEPALVGLPGQEHYPEPAELPADAARLRLFHFLAETLAALAEQAEVLLVLDDLQWADELTLGFLEYWLRLQGLEARPAGGGRSATGRPEMGAAGQTPQEGAPKAGPVPVLLVGAYRSEDVGAQQAAPLWRSIESSGVTRIDLGRLDEPAVASIVGDMLALEPAPPLFSRYLVRHSEGNPFFVAEYLRAMLEGGADGRLPLLGRDEQGRWQVAEPAGAPAEASSAKATEADYEALPLPRTLRELVGRRLAGLPEAAQRLVEAAAILGRETDLELLERTAGSAGAVGASALAAVSELLRRQVLELSAPGRIRFVHDKLCEVAHEAIPADRRPGLHRAAAESIEALHAADLSDDNATLGRHWEEAGLPYLARPCYLAAARKATKQANMVEGERLYQSYLRLVQEPEAERVRARHELGENILQARGRNDEALREHELALEEARSLGDRKLEGDCLRGLAALHLAMSNLDEARRFSECSLEFHIRHGYQRGEAKALGNLAQLHAMQGRMDEACRFAEQALDAVRQVGDRRGEGSLLIDLALMLQEQGRWEEALPLHEQALTIVRQSGNRPSEANVLGNLALLYLRQGRLEEARPLFEQGLNIARQTGDLRPEAPLLLNLALLHQEQGRIYEAHKLYEQALAVFRQTGDRRGEGATLVNLAILDFQQGRLEESRSAYDQGLAVLRRAGDRRWEGIALSYLAELELFRAVDLQSVEELLGQAERLLAEARERFELAGLLCRRGFLTQARGQSGGELLRRAEALAPELRESPESEYGRPLARLRRAVQAFEAGEQHRLFRGMLIEDIPEGLHGWLRETGQLPA